MIRTRVSEPLHLESIVPDENETIVSGRARFYSLSGDHVANSPYTDLSDRWPSGGFLATAGDLARFGAAHLADGYLRPETRALVFTSQKTSDGKETGVGFAWRIGTMANHRVYHHGGDSIGGRAFLLLRPDEGARGGAGRQSDLREIRGATGHGAGRYFCVKARRPNALGRARQCAIRSFASTSRISLAVVRPS